MKVVGISGSPRKGGNTECLIKESLNEFVINGWEISEFRLSDTTIKPCIGCDACVKHGVCAITDLQNLQLCGRIAIENIQLRAISFAESDDNS